MNKNNGNEYIDRKNLQIIDNSISGVEITTKYVLKCFGVGLLVYVLIVYIFAVY